MFPTEPLPESIGAYKILRRLAGLGSATMFLGRRDGPLGFRRICALKLVPNTGEGDPRFVEEIAREASICAKLNHPAIVRMFDFFEHEDQLVLVLEHVEGANLDRLLQHLISRQQKLGDAAVYYLAYRIAGALAHAHAATDETGSPTPVIHRNLHPENIVIGWDGQVRLTGFGVGKIVGRTPDTVAGVVKGTPGYMSPEQARGERVTTKADVYGLGILLWSLLSGKQPPIDGTRPAAILTLRHDLPRPIATLIDGALAPLPDGRKITCLDIEQTLAKVARPDRGKAELVLRIQSAHATIEVEDADREEDRRPTIPVKKNVQTTRPGEITRRFGKDLRRELVRELAASGALQEGALHELDAMSPAPSTKPDRGSKPELATRPPPLRISRPDDGIEPAGTGGADAKEALTLPPSGEPPLVVAVKSEGWKPALPDRETFGRLFDAAKRASERDPQVKAGPTSEELAWDEVPSEEVASGDLALEDDDDLDGATLVQAASGVEAALKAASRPSAASLPGKEKEKEDEGTLPSRAGVGLPPAGARGTPQMPSRSSVEFGPPPPPPAAASAIAFGSSPDAAIFPPQFSPPPPPELTPRSRQLGLLPGMLIEPTPARHRFGAAPQSSAPGLSVQVASGAERPAPSSPPQDPSPPRQEPRLLSTLGTVAVSAVTATFVVAVWIIIARRDRASPVPAAPSASALATEAAAGPPPIPAPEPPPAPPEPPPAPTPAPAPAALSAPAASEAAAVAAPGKVDLAQLPPGHGSLTVGFPEAGNVFLTGRLMGPINQPLTVRCGRYFLRLARPGDKRNPQWLTPGMTLNVACHGSTRVDVKPPPTKAPRR